MKTSPFISHRYIDRDAEPRPTTGQVNIAAPAFLVLAVLTLYLILYIVPTFPLESYLPLDIQGLSIQGGDLASEWVSR